LQAKVPGIMAKQPARPQVAIRTLLGDFDQAIVLRLKDEEAVKPAIKRGVNRIPDCRREPGRSHSIRKRR
jgi:hypothetical protein